MAGSVGGCRGRKPARNQWQDRQRDALRHRLAGAGGQRYRTDDPSTPGFQDLFALGHGHGIPLRQFRVRTNNAPANFATCRHIVYYLTRKAPGRHSIRLRRKTAGGDGEYLGCLVAA